MGWDESPSDIHPPGIYKSCFFHKMFLQDFSWWFPLRGYPTFLSDFLLWEYMGQWRVEDLKEINTPASTHFSRFCPEGKQGFPGGSVVKNLPDKAGDAGNAGLIPESGRSPAEGNGNPLQYSCLGNSLDRGAWWAAVHGAIESRT